MSDKALGIDIGGTKTCLALVSPERGLIRSMRFQTQVIVQNRAALVPKIVRFLNEEKISYIGIGLKGLICPDHQTILRSSVLSQVLPWDLSTVLKKEFGVPCWIDNDVHAAALGEMMFGFGKQVRHLIYVNVGTGLAIAVVDEGRLIRGAHNIAGEIGSAILKVHNNAHQLEDIASGSGIVAQAKVLMRDYPHSKLHGISNLTGRQVVDAAEAGDPVGERVLTMMTEAIAYTVYNLTVLFDPNAIIFGGGIMNNEHVYMDVLRKTDQLFECLHGYEKPMIELTTLGIDTAGAIGAAAVAITYSNLQGDKING